MICSTLPQLLQLQYSPVVDEDPIITISDLHVQVFILFTFNSQ